MIVDLFVSKSTINIVDTSILNSSISYEWCLTLENESRILGT